MSDLSQDLKLLYRFGDPSKAFGDLSAMYGLGPTLDFTRADNATYYDENGILRTASPGLARTHTYDPSTLEPVGLLVENESTNEVRRSNEFDSASWAGPSVANTTPNTHLGPDGILNADTVADLSAANTDRHYQDVSMSGRTQWTGSYHIRKDSIPASTRVIGVQVEFRDGSATSAIIKLDTSTGQHIAGVRSGPSTLDNSGVVEGSTYWRVFITVTDGGGNSTTRISLFPAFDNSLDDVGFDVTVIGDCVAYGSQLEPGPVMTSYIDNPGTSALVRPADVVSTTDVSWYNQSGPGSFFYNTDQPAVGDAVRDVEVALDDASFQNYLTFHTTATGNKFGDIYEGGIPQAAQLLGAAIDYRGSQAITAVGVSPTDDYLGYTNGDIGGRDSGYTLPAVTTFYLASQLHLFRPPQLTIQEVRYYNTRRPDDQPYTVPGTGGLLQLSLGEVPEQRQVFAYSPDLTLLYRFNDPSKSLGDLSATYGLGPTLDFTRADDATYYDENGILQTAGPGVARTHSHNPTTLEPVGLLVEDAGENRYPYSNDFRDLYGSTGWRYERATWAATTTIQPDGTTGGYKILDDAQNGAHSTYASLQVTGSGAQTFSIYAKAAEWSNMFFDQYSSTGSSPDFGILVRVRLSLITGEILIQQEAGGADIKNINIIPLPNGWWRIEITADLVGVAGPGPSYIGPLDDAGEAIFIGDGTKGIEVFGAQDEDSPVATSLTQTDGGLAAVRPADVVSTDDVSWYSQEAPGTLYAESINADYDMQDSQGGIVSIDASSLRNIIAFRLHPVNDEIRTVIVSENVGLRNAGPLVEATDGLLHRSVAGFQVGESASATDGLLVAFTLTDLPVDLINKFRIGQTPASNEENRQVYIPEVRYYNTRRPDDQDYTGPGTGGLLQLSRGGVPELDYLSPETTGTSDDLTLLYQFDKYPALSPPYPGLGPTLDFRRASGATYYNAQRILKTALDDVPRFTHDPATGEPRGLLVEDDSRNEITNPTQLDSINWTKIRSTVEASGLLAPGVLSLSENNTVFKVIEDATAANTHYARPANLSAVKPAAAEVWTAYTFLHAGEKTKSSFKIGSNITARYAEIQIDLTTGQATTNAIGDFVIQNWEVVALPNSWFYLSITALTDAVTTELWPAISLTDDNFNDVYDGDGVSGLYGWGFGLEQSPVVTSPNIDHNGTATVRPADVVDTQDVGWYAQDADQTWYTGVQYPVENDPPGISSIAWSLDDGSVNNNLRCYASGTSNNFLFALREGNVQRFTVRAGDLSENVRSGTPRVASIGMTDPATNTTAFLDGVQGSNDGSYVLPSALTTLRFGRRWDTAERANQVLLQELRHYSTRRGDDEDVTTLNTGGLLQLSRGGVPEARHLPIPESEALSDDLTLLYQFDKYPYPNPPYPGVGPTLPITRAGPATYYNEQGVLKTALDDVWRFTYDPTTPTTPQLLVEDEGVNRIDWSDDLTQWTNNSPNVTFNAGDSLSPEGKNNAYAVIESAVSSTTFQVSNTFVGRIGENDSCSVFLKAITREAVQLQWLDANAPVNRVQVDVDLANKTLSGGRTNGTGWTYNDATIEQLPNDWVRVSLQAIPGSSSQRIRVYGANPLGTITYDGDGSSWLVWRAQSEFNPFATSPIYTDDVSNVRPADVISTTEVGWYAQGGAGTFSWTAQNYDIGGQVTSNYAPYFGLYQAAANFHQHTVYVRTGSNNQAVVLVRDGATEDPNGLNYEATAVDRLDGVAHTMAHGWDGVGDFQAYTLGTAGVGRSTSVTASASDTFALGAQKRIGAFDRHEQIRIRDFRYYNTRRLDDEVQTLAGEGGLLQLSQGLVLEPFTALLVPPPPGDDGDIKFWWKPSDAALHTDPPESYPVNGAPKVVFDMFSQASGGFYYDDTGTLIGPEPNNDVPRYNHDPNVGNLSIGLLHERVLGTTNLYQTGGPNPTWFDPQQGIWYVDVYYDQDAAPVDITTNHFLIYFNNGGSNYHLVWMDLTGPTFNARARQSGNNRDLTITTPVAPDGVTPNISQRFRLAWGYNTLTDNMEFYVGRDGADLGAGVSEGVKVGQASPLATFPDPLNNLYISGGSGAFGQDSPRVNIVEARYYDKYASEQFLQDLASGRDIETQPPVTLFYQMLI